MIIISKYLSYKEATKSETAIRLGIDNTPTAEVINAMQYVATQIFDVCREFVEGPLFASSFFRCAQLNAAVQGARNSQHINGEAIDIDTERYGGKTNKELFEFIRDNLAFDQLIWEFGNDENPEWVHCSKVDEVVKGRKNRGEILRAYKLSDGSTKYIPYQ